MPAPASLDACQPADFQWSLLSLGWVPPARAQISAHPHTGWAPLHVSRALSGQLFFSSSRPAFSLLELLSVPSTEATGPLSGPFLNFSL